MNKTQRNVNLPDFYEMFGINKLASTPTIVSKLDDIKHDSRFYNDQERIELLGMARIYLVENREIYDKYLKDIGVKFPESNKQRQARHKKLVRGVITTGVIIALGVGAITAGVNHIKKTDAQNNVCVEYHVQYGDTKNDLGELKDSGFSYYEVSGSYRNNNLLYVGDVVIGRTTKEHAYKLVEEGTARIITIDEAVELLGENHSLLGEFKKYAEGQRDFEWYVPITKELK